jgi:hypothetical protein
MTRYYEDDDEDHIDMRPLLRLAAWGACTIVALGGAVFAGQGEVATERLGVALATLRAAPDLLAHPMSLLKPRPSSDDETARLNEMVRTLTADRDQLAARVATLERNLNDLTGSVSRDQSAVTNAASAADGPPKMSSDDKPAPPAVAFPPPASLDGAAATEEAKPAAVAAVAAAEPPQPGVGLPANVPLPRPGPLATIQSYVSSTLAPAPPPAPRLAEAARGTDANAANEPAPKEFAVDLATATNVNALRVRWGTIRTGHPSLVEGLRPLISVRDSARPGFTEFHLVAGPIADADAAARLCSALTTARIPCRPAPFDGQSLDLR